MSRKSSKKKHLRQPPVAPAPAPRLSRTLAIAALLFVASSLISYEAAKYFAPPAGARNIRPEIIKGDGIRGPQGMAWVPGGAFLMGSDHKLAQRNERPVHNVRVHGFWMDQTHVTNAQFAMFVKATGYVTTAERKPGHRSVQPDVAPRVQAGDERVRLAKAE